MSNPISHEDVHPWADVGPVAQVLLSAAIHGIVATVPHSGSLVSNLIQSNGYKQIAVGCTSTKAGAVSIQRYLDKAGTIVQGAAVAGTLVAVTALNVNVNDGLPFQSFKVTITDTDGAVDATLSNFGILLQAN